MRWEDRDEPKGIQTLWVNGQKDGDRIMGTDKLEQTDGDNHEGGGKGGGSRCHRCVGHSSPHCGASPALLIAMSSERASNLQATQRSCGCPIHGGAQGQAK